MKYLIHIQNSEYLRTSNYYVWSSSTWKQTSIGWCTSKRWCTSTLGSWPLHFHCISIMWFFMEACHIKLSVLLLGTCSVVPWTPWLIHFVWQWLLQHAAAVIHFRCLWHELGHALHISLLLCNVATDLTSGWSSLIASCHASRCWSGRHPSVSRFFGMSVEWRHSESPRDCWMPPLPGNVSSCKNLLGLLLPCT